MIAISFVRNSRKRSHHAAADESIAGWYWSILRDRGSRYLVLSSTAPMQGSTMIVTTERKRLDEARRKGKRCEIEITWGDRRAERRAGRMRLQSRQQSSRREC